MDPLVARKTWRTLEPYHGLVYFAPEASDRYEALGISGRSGYFASRAAPMGAVPAEVVIATFYNFNPDLVRRAIPSAWRVATPEQLSAARLDVADAALRRVLGDSVLASHDMSRAASLARSAAESARVHGRPLFAGHASLPWPDDATPHLVLWHAITLLREYRGDGHVQALLAAGVDGCEALVLHAATGDVAAAVLQATRAWDDEAWASAVGRLAARGLVHDDGAFTDEGRARRDDIERRTDELAVHVWEAIGEAGCEELRALVRPWSRTIAEQMR